MQISTLSGAASGGPRARFAAARAKLQWTVSAFHAATVLLLGSVGVGTAGEFGGTGAPGAVVEQEIARRQQQITNAASLLAEGDRLRAEGDLPGAILNYRSAYLGMQPSQMSADARTVALSRFSVASVEYARDLIDGAQYDEAGTVVDAVLDPTFDPDNAAARKLRKQLDDPAYYNRALTPAHIANVEKVTETLREAKGLVDLADYDKAEARFHDVLRIDSTNTAARRGLEEVENLRVAYLKSARDQTRASMLRKVDEEWESAVPLENLDMGSNGGLALGGINIDGGASEIERMLANTRIPLVNLDDTSLAEAVEFLNYKSRELDPLGRGADFVLALAPEDTVARNARINLILHDIPMGDLLGYLTKDTGTKFTIDRFAVTILSQARASEILVTESFVIPPDFLNTAPGGDGGGIDDPFADPDSGGGTALRSRAASAKDFLVSLGIPFPEGAIAFYNPASSKMTVRNTQTAIDTITEMVESSRRAGPRQVVMAVKLIEINETLARELGVETLLGAFNLPGLDRIFAAGGTQGNTLPPYSGSTVQNDFPFIPPGSDVPLGVHPITAGNRSGSIAQPNDSIDGRLTNMQAQGPNTRAPAVFAVAGALTDPQFQTVLRALDQTGSVDVMTSPSVVSRSGQRATIDVVREFIYPSEYDPPEIPQDFGSFQSPNTNFIFDPITGLPIFSGFTPNGAGNNIPVTPAHPTAFEMRPVGTKLEVEPVIGPDGYILDLNISIELNRFEGFINYGSPITTGTQILTENEILMPIFSPIKEGTAVSVYDGSTLVIGGLVNDIDSQTNDRTPFFSDIPILGRLFRTSTSVRQRKVIMIFVSTRIIDPSGDPVNVAGR